MIVLSVCVFAQNSDDDYKRNEFYAGFSHQQVGNRDHDPFNGFEVSYVRNVHRYIGIKGDFSAAYRNLDFTSPAFNTTGVASATVRFENRRSLYNFLGGVQIKDNASEARFKPFAHALVGVAHNRNTTKNITCISNCSALALNTDDFTFSDTGFGGAFGGGIDLKVNDKIDFRLIQVDYNPVYTNSRVNNNFRFGVGFVFK
jgi:opacity protein-like surface antigen